MKILLYTGYRTGSKSLGNWLRIELGIPYFHEYYNKSNEDDHKDIIVKGIVKEFPELDKKLKYANFVDYNKTLVSVPEGFRGNLLDYLKLLNKVTPDVYSSANTMLAEYHTMLANFVTNKDSKISLRDETGFFKKITHHREDINKQINHYFPTGGSTSKQYLGTVIHRFADIHSLVDEVKNLDRKHVAQNLKTVNGEVQECVELLNIIIDHNEKNAISTVSGEAAMNIAAGTYEVAKYIEFLSIYRFKTMLAITAVEKLIQQFNDVLK